MTSGVILVTADGLRLEAELDAANYPRAGLVLCHPHPKMDGTMNAPLLLALCDELLRPRWPVLRFNFRGIGASEGEPSTGEDEAADARAAIALFRERDDRLPLAIAGWSFGGAVAVRAAAQDDSLIGCAAIAPAVEPRTDIAGGLPPADQLDLGVPVLFVCGANDEVISPSACRRWLEGMEHATLIEMPGANHFFWGRYDGLSSTVAGWLDARL